MLDAVDSATAIPSQEMRSSTSPPPDHTPNYSTPQTQSRLLSLPQELQLAIWEFAVIDEHPLLVNCPCDSSFGGWTQAYYAARKLWENGTRHAPKQPAITQTCKRIRADALPIFYMHNRFQSGYCHETHPDASYAWLKAIGVENRKLLRHFYFYDANHRHDMNCPNDLKRIQRSKTLRALGGKTEGYRLSSSGLEAYEYLEASCRERANRGERYCRHEVNFSWEDEHTAALGGLEQLFGEENECAQEEMSRQTGT